jgi:hypothetical protein
MRSIKKILLAAIFITINSYSLVLGTLADEKTRNVIEYGIGKLMGSRDGDSGITQGVDSMTLVSRSLLIITWLFFLDVFVLWLLSRMGGPFKTYVNTSIERFGGSVWTAGAAFLGTFMALTFAFCALRVLSR